MYSFNFNSLIQLLLPRVHRKPVMTAWLEVLLYPVKQLHDLFIALRDSLLYDARVTGQVNSLEWMLNDKFYNDGTLRSIYISDNTGLDNDVLIYQSAEAEPETYLFNTSESAEDDTYIFQTGEGIGGEDFIVNVPDALVFDEEYMKSLINKFKIAGKTYKIVTY